MKRLGKIFGLYLALTVALAPVWLLFAFFQQPIPRSGFEWACFFLLPVPLTLIGEYIFGTYWHMRWTNPFELIAEKVSSSPWRLVFIFIALVLALTLGLVFSAWMKL